MSQNKEIYHIPLGSVHSLSQSKDDMLSQNRHKLVDGEYE